MGCGGCQHAALIWHIQVLTVRTPRLAAEEAFKRKNANYAAIKPVAFPLSAQTLIKGEQIERPDRLLIGLSLGLIELSFGLIETFRTARQ